MTDQVVRKPQVLYRLMRSDRHAPRRSFHITPLEEEAMTQYARVKSRIAHIAQYRRARLLYQYVESHYPDVVLEERKVSIAQRCMLVSQSLLFLGTIFLIGVHDLVPIRETLVVIFGTAALLFCYGFLTSLSEQGGSERVRRELAYKEAALLVDSAAGSSRYVKILREWKVHPDGSEGIRYWCRFDEVTTGV